MTVAVLLLFVGFSWRLGEHHAREADHEPTDSCGCQRLAEHCPAPLDCLLNLYSIELHRFPTATTRSRRQKIKLLKANDKWSVRRGISLSGLIINSYSIPS